MSGSEMKAAAVPPVQAGGKLSPRCEGLLALSSDWDLGFLGRELFSLALETPPSQVRINYRITDLVPRSFSASSTSNREPCLYLILYYILRG